MLPLFPSAASLCTRVVVHVRLRHAAEPGVPATVRVVDLKDVLDASSYAASSAHDAEPLCLLRSAEGGGEGGATSEDTVRAKIEQVLGPARSSTREVCTDKVVQITVRHPRLPTLDLIDLPGLIGAEKSSKAVRDLATRFIDR